MRVRVTIEYDYEDPDAYQEQDEINFWATGDIDVPTLNDGAGCKCIVKCEVVADAVEPRG